MMTRQKRWWKCLQAPQGIQWWPEECSTSSRGGSKCRPLDEQTPRRSRRRKSTDYYSLEKKITTGKRRSRHHRQLGYYLVQGWVLLQGGELKLELLSHSVQGVRLFQVDIVIAIAIVAVLLLLTVGASSPLSLKSTTAGAKHNFSSA